MSDARTIWRAKPCGWRDRERVVALGDEQGPGGPLVLDVLEELAKEQRAGGAVRTGLRSLARAAFLPRGTEGTTQVRGILATAEAVGALDELVVGDDAGMTVTCRVSGFEADQGKGYEAVRKGQQRAAAAHPDVDQTDRDDQGLSPDARDIVPECPPTGQDRTGEEKVSSDEDTAGERPLTVSGVKRADVERARRLLVVFNELTGRSVGERTSTGAASSLLGRVARLLAKNHGALTVEQWEQGMRRHAADPPDVIRSKGGVREPGDFFGDTHHLRVMELGEATSTSTSTSTGRGLGPVSQEDRDAEAGRDAVERRLSIAREQAASRGDDLSEPDPEEAAVLPADWRQAS